MTSKERFNTAVQLKEPDRVPITPLMDYYHAFCAGITPVEYVLGDFEVAARAVRVTHERHGNNLDMAHIPIGRIYAFFEPIPAAHSGFYQRLKIPNELGQSLQFIEDPILDINDFPLLYKEGFSRLWRPVNPKQIRKTLHDLIKIKKFIDYWEKKRQVPIYTGGAIVTPLETLSYLCGIKRWSRYLRKNREELKQMCDFMIKGMMGMDYFLKKITGIDRAYVCLERVSNTFISEKIFEELVYPYLEIIVKENNKMGLTNLFHMDTEWTPFFHLFARLIEENKGKYILHLENSDIFQAKKVIGDAGGAIMGNVNSTLQTIGSRHEIEKYVQKLIDICAPGGGFLLGSGCEISSNAPFENIQIMINHAKKHGVYRK
ncbi:MAG: uroporphyrinogen decarboxylase family protein [Candidatus Helarchaeota archaeon]